MQRHWVPGNAPRSTILLGLALLSGAGASAGTPFAQTGPFFLYSPDGGATRTTVHTNQWVSIDAPSSTQGLTGTMHLRGQGDTGIGKAAMTGTGEAYAGLVFAGWHDRFSIQPDDPRLIGRTARMTFDLGYSWSAQVRSDTALLPGNTDFGLAYVDVSLLGGAGGYAAFIESIEQSCTAAGSCGTQDVLSMGSAFDPVPANGAARFSFQVVLGTTYGIVLGMNTGLQAMGGMVTIDASNSMTWRGIQSITVDGQPVAASVPTLSGLNFLAPIPEPSTWLLWGVGLLAVARARGFCHGVRDAQSTKKERFA